MRRFKSGSKKRFEAVQKRCFEAVRGDPSQVVLTAVFLAIQARQVLLISAVLKLFFTSAVQSPNMQTDPDQLRPTKSDRSRCWCYHRVMGQHAVNDKVCRAVFFSSQRGTRMRQIEKKVILWPFSAVCVKNDCTNMR